MYRAIPTERSCARAWVAAASAIIETSDEGYNVVIDIEDPCTHSARDNAVINLVDRFLRQHDKHPIVTVANTIFPQSLYVAHGSPAFYGEYLKEFDRLSVTKRWGRYFERMTRHTDADGVTYNPLSDLIEKMKRQERRGVNYTSAYELAVYDPLRDRKSLYGGQCLSFLSFKRHPERGLMLTVMYRNHTYITRCLGNLIGLGRLQAFIAKEVGTDLGSLTVISTHAKLDTGKGWGIRDARALVVRARDLLDSAAPTAPVPRLRVDPVDVGLPQMSGGRPRHAGANKADAGRIGSIHSILSVPDEPLPALGPLTPTPVYNTFWRFAAERQRVFFERLRRGPPPWTDDAVLRAHKFTNAYRASDRVSQYLIRSIIYRPGLSDEPTEVVFRILLFKLFNRIETWELLEREFGTPTYTDYSFSRYDRVLSAAMARGDRIYSGAYIMPSGQSFGHDRKHRNHLALLGRMMADGLPTRLAESASMESAFRQVRRYPGIGDFLALQYVIDVNYSQVTNFSEMDFVVAGPGAVDGMRKCFADARGMSNADVIRLVAERQEVEFERLGLEFLSLWGRKLQLIDCQNLFCEVGKYARVKHPDVTGNSGRRRIKQRFRPSPAPIQYWYPPKWGINTAALAAQTRHPKDLGISQPNER